MITKLANKKANLARGYTIIEVMIFLVVSSVLFTAALAAFNQQNRRTKFTDTVQQFDQSLRDILNDVETGYFTTGENFRCRLVGGVPDFQPPGVTPSQRGTNEECTFVGKAIQIAPSERGVSSYAIYTMAGRRVTGSPGNERTVERISEASPRVVPATFGGVIFGDLSSGIEFYRVLYSGGTQTDGLAMINGFGRNTTTSGASLKSGFNRVSLATIAPAGDSSFSHSTSNFTSRVASLNDTRISDSRDGITICIRESGGGRTAAVQLGGVSQQASTVVRFDNEALELCGA